MVRLSVSQAAPRLGVNVQRVHQLIADGSLPAERVGRQWAIDEADLVRLDRHSAGRPLSPRSAWSMAVLAVPRSPSARADADAPSERSALGSPERSRARSRLRDLLAQVSASAAHRGDESAALDLAARLRSLLRRRADRRVFRSSPRDLEALRSDGRISLSGISLPGSGMASADIVEGYVVQEDLDHVVRDFLLSHARPGEANVVLHVVDSAAAPHWRVEPDNWLLLAADLAEHHRPREVARAVQILSDAVAPSRGVPPRASK